MEYTIVDMPERHIIGPTTRTANNDPETPAKIGKLWEDFMKESMKSIPEPILEPYECFGLYYNYDFSDMSYDTQVGCESNADQIPDGMERVVIPAGKYAKFVVQGDVVESVIKAWNDIWSMEDLMAQRANTVDYEAYLPSTDMKNTTTELYIAVK